MAKLTKKQTAELMRILGSLGAAHQYLHSDRTVICRTDTMATTTLHRPGVPMDDRILLPMEKHGSDLVRLSTGIDELREFVHSNT